MNIEYSPNSDFILSIACIIIILLASSVLASAHSSMDNNRASKIDNIKHVEGLDEVDDISEIDKTYKLSEIGLTDKQEQHIMNEKSITTTKELTIDDTVALTTDSGSYIVNVEMIHPILTGTIMSLVSFILFCCIFLIHKMIDNRFWRDVFLQLFAVGGSIVSISFVYALSAILLLL